MDFRRSGQLDERRRRVLMDEIAAPSDADASTAATAAKGPVRAYHADVLTDRQPRITDLLPVRPLWVVVALLLGLTGIATVEAIHVHAVTLPFADGAPLLSALDASQRGSLAACYSAALLAVASLLALITYAVRVHRVDDYRGHYRIWLWTAAALAWLSLDAATGIRESLGLGLTLLAGKQVFNGPLAAGCTITWVAVYSLLFGALAIRLAVELWPSTLSFSTLVTSAAIYFFAGLLELQIFTSPGWLIPGVLQSTIVLLAHFSLASAVGLYARHVYLDATGRLKVNIDRDKKPKAKSRTKLKVVKADKTEETKPRPVVAVAATASDASRARPTPQTISPSSKASVAISKTNLASPDEDEEDDAYDDDGLSKSERRRLKKLARRDQQRRAA